MAEKDFLIQTVLALGAQNAAQIPLSKVPFAASLRKLCESNQCGNYGRNWMCPPLIGNIEQLMDKIQQFQFALIFQRVYPLEDSFDIEGMDHAMRDFRALTQKIAKKTCALLSNSLVLSCGGCVNCKICAALSGKPCIHPEHAFASLEAYGIQVSELAAACEMKYINGPNTVTYFGGIFY